MELPHLRLPVQPEYRDWLAHNLPRYVQEQGCSAEFRPLYSGRVAQFTLKRWFDAQQIEQLLGEMTVNPMPDGSLDMYCTQYRIDARTINFFDSLYRWLANAYQVDIRPVLPELIMAWRTELWMAEQIIEHGVEDPQLQRSRMVIDDLERALTSLGYTESSETVAAATSPPLYIVASAVPTRGVQRLQVGNRRMHLSTEEKLDRLCELREAHRRSTTVTIGFTTACQRVGIDAKTVNKHAPELRGKWHDHNYESRWQSKEAE
jgi:hypothetical protein